MARFSANFRFVLSGWRLSSGPAAAGAARRHHQAANLTVEDLDPAGLTAQITGRRNPCDQRLALSWGQAGSAPGTIAVGMELHSHAMRPWPGAPITRTGCSHEPQKSKEEPPDPEQKKREEIDRRRLPLAREDGRTLRSLQAGMS